MNAVFSRRDMAATVSVHMLFAAMVTAALTLEQRYTPEVVLSLPLAILAVVVAVATGVFTSAVAVWTWRTRQGIDTTSVWDPVTSLVQLGVALVATYALGGFAGVGWMLVLVLVPYFGVVFGTGQLRVLALG